MMPADVPMLVAASVPQAPLSGLFLSFLVYGFGGWLWESTVCSMMNQRRFSNSGFLLGPICPIYGVGCLFCWLFLRGVENPVAQFLVSGLACCALEYVVGVALEKTCGARFWNYDDKPLNIHGRVCLYGFLMFGAGATLVCRVTQPALLAGLSALPAVVLAVVAMLLGVVLALDLVLAMASWRRLSAQLESLRTEISIRLDESLGEASDRMLERLPDSVVEGAAEAYERTRDAASELVSRLDPRVAAAGLGSATDMMRSAAARARGLRRPPRPEWLERAAEAAVVRLGKRDLRFFNAFPRMRIERYEGAITRSGLRDRARELFGRKQGVVRRLGKRSSGESPR